MASAVQAAREIPGKGLFRIGEVSRLTSTKAFVLRFWESEFPTLQPVKSPSGHRLYRREDIDTVLEIKRLLYEQGFTIAGARKYLAEQGGEHGSMRGGAGGEAVASAREVVPSVQPAARPPSGNGVTQKLLSDLHEELLVVLTLLKRE
jgi:DNA-binding transcriptional MerR regulator